MIGIFLIFLGSALSIVGAAGLLRFPDIYSRTHAQTVVNVGGTCLVLLGIFLDSPFPSLLSTKSILLIAFIFLTSPVGSHAIARAAYKSGVQPKKLHEDELKYKIEKEKEADAKVESRPMKEIKPSFTFRLWKLRRRVKKRIEGHLPNKD